MLFEEDKYAYKLYTVGFIFQVLMRRIKTITGEWDQGVEYYNPQNKRWYLG